MSIVARTKSVARRLLGAPFRLDPRDSPPEVEFELIATHHPKLRSPTVDGHDFAMSASRAKKWELRDYVATIRAPVLLDTGLGWVIRGRNLLEVGNWSMVAQSVLLNKPSVVSWAKATVGAEEVGPSVWLPFGSGNYWHFLNDMVAGLALLAERRDLSRCVVLVSEELAGMAFFKEILALSTWLSGLHWRPYRSDRWLRSCEVHVAGTSFGSYATFRRAIALLDRLPALQTSPQRRLFITRGRNSNRTPINITAIEQAVRQRGFDVIDFDGMKVVEQRALINEGSMFVGVHGAGLANLAFHNAPATAALFEITPSDYINPCFAYMAEEAGMDYFCFAGGPRDSQCNDRFNVPIDAFLDALDQFLSR